MYIACLLLLASVQKVSLSSATHERCEGSVGGEHCKGMHVCVHSSGGSSHMTST